MGYLIRNDYKTLIQTDNLSQIIGADYTLLNKAEQVAESEIISYLTQKYLTDREFTETKLWAPATVYSPADRVYLDGTTYSASLTYVLNSVVLYSGNIYRCQTAISTPEAWNAAKWQLVGAQYEIHYYDPTLAVNAPTEWDYYTEYLEGDFVWYGTKKYEAVSANSALRPDLNTAQWGAGTTITVTGITLTDGTNVWVEGDNRNQQMVNYMIDIVLYHLHSRIAPRNIPDLRVKRYDDAVGWLKQCAKGDHLTASLPKIQPTQGMRNRYGGGLPKQNNTF